MKIFYLGWIGHNNIGDDLMLDVFRKIVNKKYSKCGIYPSYPEADLNEINNYDVIVLGGGSILLPGYIDVLSEGIKRGKKVIVWGSGYDLLERDIMNRLENSNMPAYLFTEDEEIKLNIIADNVSFFGVRGPLTYKVIEKSFVNMDKVLISGDPGLLLDKGAVPDGCPINEIIDEVIGVNIGTSFNRVFGGEEANVIEELVKVCNQLTYKGYYIYLFTMWDRDIQEINRFYKLLDNKDMVVNDTNLYSGETLVGILSKCKLTINFKLHANIISAVANTPFICLGYRMKGFDFAKSIECEDLVIGTDEENIRELVMDKVDYILNNENEIKNKMNKKIGEYKSILENAL